MNFVSVEFWMLVVATVLGCRLCRNQNGKLIIISLSSCFFYAWWDYRFLLLLLAYITVTYVISRIMRPGNKGYVIAFLILSLSLLGGFKYFNFFIETLSGIVGTKHQTLNIILPLGISFYILTAIGYVLDVYYGKYAADSNYLKVLVFVIFFPKLLSGPIERVNKFFEKLDHIENLTRERCSTGIQVIVLGLIKKLVIADRLGVCVDAVFGNPDIYSAPALLCAVLSYAIQIYCDFSGYTDIAIGVSYLIGIRLDNNFNLPYCAKNPAEFWRRWHISLSSWFKDYVYIPLGGSRKGKISTYRNIMITMLISGLWHGANWTFILWGALHGVAQCLHKMFSRKKKSDSLLCMLLNFIFVTIAWTFFRADSVASGCKLLTGILKWQSGVQYIYVFTPIYIVLVLGMEYLTYRKNNGQAYYPLLDLRKSVQVGVFTAEILLLIALAYFGNSAFIYNNF